MKDLNQLNEILDKINKENNNLEQDIVNKISGFLSRVINAEKYWKDIRKNTDAIVHSSHNELEIFIDRNKNAKDTIKTKIASLETQNSELEKRTKYILYFISFLALSGIFPASGLFEDIVNNYIYWYNGIVTTLLALTIPERINSSRVVAQNKSQLCILRNIPE